LSCLGILTVDEALTVRGWDAWIAAVTGIAAEAAIGQSVADVVPDLEPRGLLVRFRQVLATGEVQVLAPAFHHYLLPCAPSTPSPHFSRMQQRVTLGPLKDGDRIVGVVAAIEDVTSRMDRERDLAAALRSGDWQARRTAVAELSRHGDDDVVQTMVETLRREHRDFNVLSSVLQILLTSDVDVTVPLAALLREGDADLRIQAALALGGYCTDGAVAALLLALDDEDANVRFHALESLGRLRAAAAVDRLAAVAAGDDVFLVFPAVDALARIGDARAVPALVPLLERPLIAEPVAEALGEIGGAEVARALVAQLNAGGATVALARALARLHARYEDRYGGGALIVAEFQATVSAAGGARVVAAIDACDSADLRPLVTVLGWLDGDEVHRALARLLGQPEVRADALEAIVRQGAGTVDVLVEQLEAADPDVVLAAIVALGRLGSRRAAPAIARHLTGARPIVVAAAAALARIADPASHEALLPLLGDADPAVRQAAIGALNSLGHPDLAVTVARLLRSDDPVLRASAVRIAGYFGYPETVDALLACAADPAEGVRRAAVEHLAFLDDPRSLTALAVAVRDVSAKVRAAAAQGLAHAPLDVAEAPLVAASGDADSWVRYYAVRALGELSGGHARLAAVADADAAMHVRIAALEALGSTAGGGAADILIARAADDHPDLAAAAVRALGASTDPRAGDVLRSAVRSPHTQVRLAAVTAYRTRATVDAVEALQWTAAVDQEAAIGDAAVEALGTIARRASDSGGAGAAVAGLLAATAQAATRDHAIATLARLPETRVEDVARGLASPQPRVRTAAIAALGRMQRPEASAAIRGALDHEDATVREAAVIALERLGVRGIGRRLARMAQEDPSPVVRRAAAAAADPGEGTR
jgi:HEAT repeat protein